jgi:hypothetical protein
MRSAQDTQEMTGEKLQREASFLYIVFSVESYFCGL